MNGRIVGSFSDPTKDTSPWQYFCDNLEFENACFQIGRSLAKNNCTLIVQFEKSNYADLYAVKGYLDWIKKNGSNNHRKIIVANPQKSDHFPFQEYSSLHKSIFYYMRDTSYKWDSVRFKSCLQSDIVIFIGGGKGTELTAYSLLASKNCLMPIAAFGGASNIIKSELAKGSFGVNRLPKSLTLDELSESWSPSLLKKIELAFKEEKKIPKIVIVHGRDNKSLEELKSLIKDDKLCTAEVMKEFISFGSTLPEKWELFSKDATGVIILATPDDIAKLDSESDTFKKRARQNVWLEYGYFWGKFETRKKTLLLIKKTKRQVLDIPNDVLGIEYYTWQNSILEIKNEIQQFNKYIYNIANLIKP
ncbi:MAG: nucleotide-binding protein [Chitinophagales bacterium]|nr:nucleotide-binding protein [Chitinophagales bacterium]